MEYQGITLKGPFIAEKLTSLPTWTANDEGREIYDSTNHKKYIGNNSAWIEQNIDNIWIHANTAPTGWSIKANTSDALIACKGGANAYSVNGGTTGRGTWTQPGHTLTLAEMPNHWHYGMGEETNYTSWPWGVSSGVFNKFGPATDMNFNNPYYKSSPPNTDSLTGTDAVSHSHGGSTYRPLANVGIIIEKS